VHVADPQLGLGPLLPNEDETSGYGCDTQQADDESSDMSSQAVEGWLARKRVSTIRALVL
jgi:hypothetical protein